MITWWKALVQPVLDYCTYVWSPNQPGDIQQLEAVQRAFITTITGMGGYTYWGRLLQTEEEGEIPGNVCVPN